MRLYNQDGIIEHLAIQPSMGMSGSPRPTSKHPTEEPVAPAAPLVEEPQASPTPEATLAAFATATMLAFWASLPAVTPAGARAFRAERHALLARPRGAEPTPYVAKVLAQARAMGWDKGKWVG